MSLELICPICDSEGEIYTKKEYDIVYFGARCTNKKCHFEVPALYNRLPSKAIELWQYHVNTFAKRDSIENRNKILKWKKIFPRRKGHYLIALPNDGGIIIRYIGLLYNKWSTCYGPIDDYPSGTQFYGPIPKPEYIEK